MSKPKDLDGTFVNTGLLRDHVVKLREEKKIAIQLYESVLIMKKLSDPAVSYQYNSILYNIDQMIEYFDRMAKLLADVEDDATHLAMEIKMIIEDNTGQTRRRVSDAIML